MHFTCTPYRIDTWLIARLPQDVSAQLPARSAVMVTGTINDIGFQQVLEPDGMGGHWIAIDEQLQADTQYTAGDAVNVALETASEWIEPTLPEDLAEMLTSDDHARSVWDSTTPMTHWDWVRWINGTKNPETRQKRIAVAQSKLNKGMRRPCCFNRASCTNPYVAKSGVLINPSRV